MLPLNLQNMNKLPFSCGVTRLPHDQDRDKKGLPKRS